MRNIVEPLDKTREQRRAQRKQVLWSGVLEYDGITWPCVVLDLSATGAKIRIEQTKALTADKVPPIQAVVAISSKHFEALRARLVWLRRDLAGISFEESPARIAATLARVLPLFQADGSPIVPEQAR